MAFSGACPDDFIDNGVEWPEHLICDGDKFLVEAGTADLPKKAPQVLMPPPGAPGQLSENQQSQKPRCIIPPKGAPPLRMPAPGQAQSPAAPVVIPAKFPMAPKAPTPKVIAPKIVAKVQQWAPPRPSKAKPRVVKTEGDVVKSEVQVKTEVTAGDEQVPGVAQSVVQSSGASGSDDAVQQDFREHVNPYLLTESEEEQLRQIDANNDKFRFAKDRFM